MSRRLPLVATLLAVLLLALAPSGAGAVNPDEMLANPVLEKRARDISKQLRCLVCQNESIDQSDADLAHDLRVLVRDRLKAGDTDKQVIDYIVSRYGDFVLLDPPVELRTYILWYGTPAIGLLGLLAAALYFRRNRRPSTVGGAGALQPPPLSDDEQARVRRLLDRAGDDDESGDDKGTPS